MQTIKIKNLKINANHGVLESEKKSTQPFVISADITLTEYTQNDNLQNTINYVEACDYIVDVSTKNRYNLIETLSNEIAKELLNQFPAAKSAIVEVQKPNAPIPYSLEYVATTTKRFWSTVYLGLGSNLGDRETAIKTAIKKLETTACIKLIKTSSIIESKPYGNTNQPKFLNAVIKIETYLSPHELLTLIQNLEKSAGRKKREKWGARELDIDILIFDNLCIITDTLILPHPDMHNREFVLNPLKEIEPNLVF